LIAVRDILFGMEPRESGRRDSQPLNQLLARFLASYEARKEAQQGFEREAFLAAHPELAESLRVFLAEVEASEAPLRPISRPSALPPSAPGAAHSTPDLTTAILRRLSERGNESERYTTRDEIAHGGQGRVVRVWDEELGRTLAMKITHESPSAVADNPAAARSLGRFLEEARLTAQLDHPGIVPVHDLGLDGEGRVFFTMKLVKGRDLKAIFAQVAKGEEGWTQTRALSVLLRVCEGMAFAHSKGVIHRDLKPANVMVGRFGEVYVMDWGLARLLGQPETRELRMQGQTELPSVVHSLRHGPGPGEADASLVTLDGDVVGTPAYMSPEQAAGHIELMGPHSDVYSAGAMLYQLLAGHPPYLPPGTRLNNYAIWSRVQEGPPPPLHARAPELPAELIAITEKAMARDPARRYRDMSELAEDLRAYLEHRVVHAYETGAVAELRKWVVRNRGQAAALAAALLTALLGLARTSYVEARGRARADEQRRLADENADHWRAERANVLRLKAFRSVDELRARADELWPMSPDRVDDFEAWLADAGRLTRALEPDPASGDPGHRAVLRELRAHALAPSTDARGARGPEEERELLRARVEVLQRALAVDAGKAEPLPWTPVGDLPTSSKELNELAWPLVDPERTRFGEEARGIALARIALEHALHNKERAEASDSLAWGLFAVGRFDEALEIERQAVDLAPAVDGIDFRSYLARLEREIEILRTRGPAIVATLENRRENLAWRASGRAFPGDEDPWWHDQLVKLIDAIHELDDPHRGLIAGRDPRRGWSITRRLEFARTIEARSLTGPEARSRWEETIAALADHDVSPEYHGLRIRPQLNLLPLGPDPDSGLFEFVDLQTGEVPERDPDGRLDLDLDSGIVFVLVPRGVFWMGAQSTDPEAPGYDPLAEANEGPPFEVELGPYFLAKHEMNQAQWLRLIGENPSYYKNRSASAGRSLLFPVDSVNWDDCRAALARVGLGLPTEAQWEYAARAGTETPWWCGAAPETLGECANVLDRSAAKAGLNFNEAARTAVIDDGFSYTAPVNAKRANPFGFHGMIGNVFEWCFDGYVEDEYQRAEPFEPVAFEAPRGLRVVRGGSADMPTDMSRASARGQQKSETAHSSIGVRPARRLVE
jgi:formylglycine-generating enzyme required for sulfatase activity/tetratricopeptide (TPR) repeat protein